MPHTALFSRRGNLPVAPAACGGRRAANSRLPRRLLRAVARCAARGGARRVVLPTSMPPVRRQAALERRKCAGPRAQTACGLGLRLAAFAPTPQKGVWLRPLSSAQTAIGLNKVCAAVLDFRKCGCSSRICGAAAPARQSKRIFLTALPHRTTGVKGQAGRRYAPLTPVVCQRLWPARALASPARASQSGKSACSQQGATERGRAALI